MSIELQQLVGDFARSIQRVDARRPQAINARSKLPFLPGLGPHAETDAVRLVVEELQALSPERYRGRLFLSVRYPEISKQKCDFCIGSKTSWEWAVEVKMLRFLGDNGKLNDNILMHILNWTMRMDGEWNGFLVQNKSFP